MKASALPRIAFIAAMAAFILTSTPTRAATPVPIVNAGFENPALADGDYQSAVPNWTHGHYVVTAPAVWVAAVTGSGVWDPDTSGYTSGLAPEGENMAYATSYVGFDSGLNQVLTSTLLKDATYVLSAVVANPFLYNEGLTGDYRIELVAGGVVLATATGTSPLDDLTTITATLTYHSGIDPAQLGKPLEIRLLAVDFDDTYEVDYDDVKLTVAVAGGYSSWQTANSTAQGIAGDHDTDGVTNGIEYFSGGPNGITTGFTALPGVTNTGGTLSVKWMKASDYGGAYNTDFAIETSGTLAAGSWSAVAPSGLPGIAGTVYINGTGVTYTFPAGTRNFVRLKVTGP